MLRLGRYTTTCPTGTLSLTRADRAFPTLALELLRVDYKDSYLPDSAWRNTPRY